MSATRAELQKAHEEEIGRLVSRLAGQGADSDWALVRALVHRAVHVCADRRAGEFCALATLLAEMVQHGHDVLHPQGRTGGHRDVH
jgi:hypothetical protein